MTQTILHVGGDTSPGGRNLVILIDGTWNDPSDALKSGGGVTNVLRLHRALDSDRLQHCFYFPGVGNQLENDKLGQLLGGAFGLGSRRLRDRAYATVVTHYRPGDRLFLFGFSRGAAIARMLAHRLSENGIPEQLVMTQDGAGHLVEARPEGRAHEVEVEFLGLFDTVASFGIPADILGLPFQRINLFADLTIAPNVARALHLVSIDERREPFTPTLANHDPSRIEEVWFAGGHSDVGGGHAERRLADVTLRFMIGQAERYGLRFTEDSLDEVPANPLGLGRLHPHQESPLATSPRRLGVKRGGRWSRSLTPRIHSSVFRRMDCLGDRYRPENVLALGGGYEVVD